MEMGKKYCVFFPLQRNASEERVVKNSKYQVCRFCCRAQGRGGVGWCWVAVLARRGGRTESIPAVFGTKAGGSQPWQAAQFIAHRDKQPFTLGHLRTI